MSKGKRYRKESEDTTTKKKREKGRRFASDEDIKEKFGITDEDDDKENDKYVQQSQVRYEKRRARRQKQNKREIKISRWFYYILGILLVAALGALIFVGLRSCSTEEVTDWYNTTTKGQGLGDGFPAQIVGNNISVGNFFSVNKDVVAVSDTALLRLNTTAKVQLNHQHSYNRPILKVAGDKMMVYNLGSTGYSIETNEKTIHKADAGNNIMAADLAENGRYALVTDTTGYPSQMTVYLENNQEQYKYSFAGYYVTGIALNHDATGAVVTAISAENGGIISAVYVFDFTKETPTAVLTYPDTLITGIEYNRNGTVVAVGDTMTSIINSSTGTKVDYPYSDRQLSGYSIDGDYVALALEPYDSASTNQIVILDQTGNVFASLDITEKATSISLLGDTVAILQRGTAIAYSVNAMRNQDTSSGTGVTAFSTQDAGTDAKAVALCDESSAYILGISEIRYLKL